MRTAPPAHANTAKPPHRAPAPPRSRHNQLQVRATRWAHRYPRRWVWWCDRSQWARRRVGGAAVSADRGAVCVAVRRRVARGLGRPGDGDRWPTSWRSRARAAWGVARRWLW